MTSNKYEKHNCCPEEHGAVRHRAQLPPHKLYGMLCSICGSACDGWPTGRASPDSADLESPWWDRGHLRDNIIYCTDPKCTWCAGEIALRVKLDLDSPNLDVLR